MREMLANDKMWHNDGAYLTADNVASLLSVWSLIFKDFDLDELTIAVKPIVAELCEQRDAVMVKPDHISHIIIPKFDKGDMGRIVALVQWMQHQAVTNNGFEIH